MQNRPNPNIVPFGAEWLNNMPQGPGWFAPNMSPVVEVNNVGNVVGWLYAHILATHLGAGTNTNQTMRTWVQTVVGRPTDDAGHIIGLNQGGLGTVQWNIFPQNGNFNRGVFAADVERMVNDAVRNQGYVDIWFKFNFGDLVNQYRPVSFNYFIVLPDGTTSHNDLLNP